MIKINLLGDVPTADRTQGLFVVTWMAALVVTCTVLIASYYSNTVQVSELQGEIDLMQSQVKKLKERTHSVGDLKSKHSILEQKLQVIATLKRSKSGPVRVMDDLNTALPERAWLTGMKESEGVLRVNGFAIDNQTVASFMKDLARSDFFEKVELVESKIAAKDAVKLRQFSLDAKVRYSGKGTGGAAAEGASLFSESIKAPLHVTP